MELLQLFLFIALASTWRGGGERQAQVRINAPTVLVASPGSRWRRAASGIRYLIPKSRGHHRPCCWMQLNRHFHPLMLRLIRPPTHGCSQIICFRFGKDDNGAPPSSSVHDTYAHPQAFSVILFIVVAAVILLLFLLLRRLPVAVALILLFVVLIHQSHFRLCRHLHFCHI